MPGLHLKVAKGEAVTGRATPDPARDAEKAFLDIVPVSSTGTAVFVAAVLSGFFLGLRPATMARTFVQTWVRMIPAIAAIAAMLALGFVTKYSGMDAVLGLAFTRTGPTLYPIFGTLLGWLGVALTGSDTSSNVLFGNLQKITARKLGLSEILMASANTTGGVMAKMIDAQSIVVAAAATGKGGKEGDLLRAVFWHSIALALLVGGIVWVYAHLLTGFDLLARCQHDADVSARPRRLGMADVIARARVGQGFGALRGFRPAVNVHRAGKLALEVDEKNRAHAVAEPVKPLDRVQPGVEPGCPFGIDPVE